MNKRVRIIITLICLALAVLAGIWLGSEASAFSSPVGTPWPTPLWWDTAPTPTPSPGGGIGWDDYPYHSYLPTIRHTLGCPLGCIDPSEFCMIKGVVTGMGNRLYYTPEMEDWCDALLLIKYQGRWFCTEEEAISRGFVQACTGDGDARGACPTWRPVVFCYGVPVRIE